MVFRDKTFVALDVKELLPCTGCRHIQQQISDVIEDEANLTGPTSCVVAYHDTSIKVSFTPRTQLHTVALQYRRF